MSDQPPRIEKIATRDQLAAHIRRPFDELSVKALEIELQKSDIIISTFPKCGTTWTQQISHGLRSGGDMNFTEITHVSPWLENGHLFGYDIHKPQPFAPRLFKSHMELSELPSGGKVISVIRNPGDTLLSYYNFWSGGLIDNTKLSLEDFAAEFFRSDRRDDPKNMFHLNYWQHLIDFHQFEYDGPVLYLCYEHMQKNLSATVQRVAEFMGVDLDEELHDLIVQQSGFEFMAEHKDQFADRTPVGLFSKVVTGRVGDSKQGVSAELNEIMSEKWQQIVTPALGFVNYDEFSESLLALKP